MRRWPTTHRLWYAGSHIQVKATIAAPRHREFFKHMSPQNRLGEVGEIVPMVEFLASPRGGWVTPQTLFINGGFIAR